jgi:hypothetical protein
VTRRGGLPPREHGGDEVGDAERGHGDAHA